MEGNRDMRRTLVAVGAGVATLALVVGLWAFQPWKAFTSSTVDEALPEVDKLLDEAALSDRKELRVIHGFGSGRLRKAVAEMLQGHPHVAAVRVGAEGRGGVTVVELKE